MHASETAESERAEAPSALRQFACNANHGFQAALNVRLGRSPRRHADAHGRVPLPDGPAAPTGAILLNACNHALRPLSIPKRYQHLVEDDLIQNGVPRGAQAFRKVRRMAAGALNEIGQA